MGCNLLQCERGREVIVDVLFNAVDGILMPNIKDLFPQKFLDAEFQDCPGSLDCAVIQQRLRYIGFSDLIRIKAR